MNNKLHKTTRTLSITLLLLVAVNALYAGYLFITDPSGNSIGLATSYLVNSPFSNYLIPGIVLFVVNGMMNVIAAIASIKKYKHYGILIVVQGVLLSGWIIIQVAMVRDFTPLHISCLCIGFILIICGIINKEKCKGN